MRVLCLIAFCLVLVIFEVSTSSVLIADHGMSKMIELTTRKPYCHVHTDRGRIQTMLLASDQRRVRQMPDDAIAKLENICKSNAVNSAHQGGFIYPGTKWCGPGHIAQNDSDLGFHRKEDMCCRNHDKCPQNLLRGECRLGICNNSPYTRSHCDCDAAFRRCLQNVNSETANTIGAIFFNIVQVICFKERSPCTQWQSSNEIDAMKNTNTSAMTNNSTCEIEFVKSDRYVGSPVTSFNWRNKKEFFLNIFLRKLRLL